MADQHVTVFISRQGEGEHEDLHDLLTEQVDSVDWVGSINGQPITVRLRLAEDDPTDR